MAALMPPIAAPGPTVMIFAVALDAASSHHWASGLRSPPEPPEDRHCAQIR
jgi:hypothetical protein